MTNDRLLFPAWVVELVDTQDLKSCGSDAVAVRFRSRVLTMKALIAELLRLFLWLERNLVFLVTKLI